MRLKQTVIIFKSDELRVERNELKMIDETTSAVIVRGGKPLMIRGRVYISASTRRSARTLNDNYCYHYYRNRRALRLGQVRYMVRLYRYHPGPVSDRSHVNFFQNSARGARFIRPAMAIRRVFQFDGYYINSKV